jgi:hypothetical protein
MILTKHDLISAIDCFGGMYARVIATSQPVYVDKLVKDVNVRLFKCTDASGCNGIGNGTVRHHFAHELKSI